MSASKSWTARGVELVIGEAADLQFVMGLSPDWMFTYGHGLEISPQNVFVDYV